MFSAQPMRPCTSTSGFVAATAAIRAITLAAPPMSPFISSMPGAGLMQMPPVSKVRPLPTKTRRFFTPGPLGL
jgi:hypothetical protein